MYIREDLLNKIKEIFNIKEFTYVGTGKHFYNNNDMFIFNCGNEIIAIEIKNPNLFSIYKTKENFECPGYFYTVTKRNFLLFKENETHLRVDEETTAFPGKAFDFTSELVLLAMERNV
ncbi:MAG: hypothetical protein SOZ53_03375 [Candidatus Onthovivens sp.]|nr:hypothetical protein [Candidatus Onthovivens sp.]